MKKPIVAAYWEGAQYVARVTDYKERHAKIYGWKYKAPVKHDGERYPFAAIWEEFSTDDPTPRVVKRILVKTLAEVESARQQLITEYNAANPDRAGYFKAVADHDAKRAALLKMKPPTVGIPIYKDDLKDYDEARAKSLRATYPTVFQCFDRIRCATTDGGKEERRTGA